MKGCNKHAAPPTANSPQNSGNFYPELNAFEHHCFLPFIFPLRTHPHSPHPNPKLDGLPAWLFEGKIDPRSVAAPHEQVLARDFDAHPAGLGPSPCDLESSEGTARRRRPVSTAGTSQWVGVCGGYVPVGNTSGLTRSSSLDAWRNGPDCHCSQNVSRYAVDLHGNKSPRSGSEWRSHKGPGRQFVRGVSTCLQSPM